LLAVIVLTIAGLAFHIAGPLSAAHAGHPSPASRPALPAKSYSLPMFFEPNEGQTNARVKFLARGAGYGLFLTTNDAVLSLRRGATKEQPAAANVVRMHLEGSSSAPGVQGTQALPGKSGYFIGNDPGKWRRDVPQFARVEYKDVYPGIDLSYYGKDGQFEYDFELAPGAQPSEIRLSFQGADAHIESGELVLATAAGDIRFRAPNIYQSAADAKTTPVSGSYVQLADNKIGFWVGPYDHSRSLVIDPVVSYSTYLGGTGAESLTQVTVGADFNVYLAGSTTSIDFPITTGAIQSNLAGPQNIFIVKLTPTGSPSSQLLYSTYLGGSGTDSLAGIAVDPNTSSPNIYIAGSTSSPNFPVMNGFQSAPVSTGTHGFVSKLSPSSGTYTLAYSSYLSADGTDTITGLAVDGSQNAYLTGVTTSTLNQSNGFPANGNGFQLSSNSPGNKQFFASMVSTTQTGVQSMIYSTYFGGGNFGGETPVVIGGGIAVDPIPTTGSKVNMYFTGGTNMQSITGPNNQLGLPLLNAYQECLNQPGVSTCTSTNPADTDVILVKINPNQVSTASLLYSTYLGGAQNDVGLAVTVDSSASAYVTGSTNSGASTDWNCTTPCVTGPFTFGNGSSTSNNNAFVAKVNNQSSPNTVYPLSYFTYMGGTGPDVGNSIAVDPLGDARITGSTFSPNLPVENNIQTYQGNGDAFAALISTSTITNGNYVTYLGGSQADVGTGIALDLFSNTYVVGTTLSPPSTPCVTPCSGPITGFPITTNAFQPNLNGSQPNAFLTELGALSTIAVTGASGGPTPNPVAAGTQAAFTFLLTNTGPDPATNVTFYATVPTTGLATPPTAEITSGGTGSCGAASGPTIVCNLTTLPAQGVGSVEVNVTPAIPIVSTSYTVTGNASANGGAVTGTPATQSVNVVDFDMNCPTPLPVTAGQLATITVTFSPSNTSLGYNATITPTQVTSPTMVTSPTPTFSPTPIILSGTSSAQTTLYIQTVPRPVSTGSLFHHGPLYAALLPVGGLSLVGLGLGIRRKRGRWIAGGVLTLLFGMILLQPACSSNSSSLAVTGGTAAGIYTIKITGSAGSGAAHLCTPTLQVF
jgi:hypothetical protein